MKDLILGNRHRGRIVAREIEVPKSFWARLRLWTFRWRPEPERALMIPSPAIQTIGMFFSVDVVFLDRKWKVLRVHHGIRPFRVLGPVSGASFTLLLPAGALTEEVLQEGDELEWIPRTSYRMAHGAGPPEGMGLEPHGPDPENRPDSS